jgi:hypothetical protein
MVQVRLIRSWLDRDPLIPVLLTPPYAVDIADPFVLTMVDAAARLAIKPTVVFSK